MYILETFQLVKILVAIFIELYCQDKLMGTEDASFCFVVAGEMGAC